MRHRILEAEIKRSRIVLECIENVALPGLMEPVDEAELAPRLVLERVANPLAIGLPQPGLVVEGPLPAVHVLARGDSDPRQQWIGFDRLAHARPEISNRRGIVAILAQAVLALGPPYKDIPGKPVDLDASIAGVLHDLAPEADLLVDGHLPDDLDVPQPERLRHLAAVHAEPIIHAPLFLTPVGDQSHVGKFR